VYLSSFGTKNIGTGQLCVYGLLPNGASPAPPAHLNAVINDRFVVVDWSPVPDARTYTVESTQGGKRHVIASGLTLPSFSEPAADRGVTEYTVMAVNANGHSVRSLPAVVTITDVPGSRMDH
jgi:hypothetical protein